jgi:alpha-beta hydrolase superfamily lysophospholipase
LAAIDRPTLIIVATRDTLYPENALIFEHIGTPEKTLISFVGPSHMMIYNDEEIAKMAHFATAFFSYYLQGHEENAKFFSEEFTNKYDDLFWGIYKE